MDDVVGTDDDTFIKTLIVTMKPIIRNVLFHLDILKSMDLSGGILSYEWIKILRCVEIRSVLNFYVVLFHPQENYKEQRL